MRADRHVDETIAAPLEQIGDGRLDREPIAGEPGKWLLAVRRGEVPFDEWRERIGVLDAELERLGDDKQYRAGPDKDAINRLSIEIHRRAWGWL